MAQRILLQRATGGRKTLRLRALFEAKIAARRALGAVPAVQLFVEITGPNDAPLLASVRDMHHFNRFADELASMPFFRHYETSCIKRTLSSPRRCRC